ncbi:MAG: hypothetical protein ONB48_00955 [candidate division KSB1 bacterium]|nr:hypothetical protein [candidate division KSB1 bacterium]MDZ7272754.1 hypothetical protein [candidate division KSB1 bacterium]MDZ7284222.1 hypothetical protein [candidate division KSB1 bacterium]MDZ7297380.1 hypothetical protein [candidate division KSB1 bacterium]MDZ7308977.1 hypothetical protein [candidate division KSB1 bacterium]
MKKFAGIGTLLLWLPLLLPAQTIKVEAMRPQFKFGNAEPSTFTSAWFVTVTLPVIKDGVSFVGQLPFAFGKLENAGVPTSDETLGNPGFGLHFGGRNHALEVMLRLPVTKNDFAAFVGSIADFDRQEAFIPDLIPLTGRIRTKLSISKFSLHPYGGVSFNIKTERGQNQFFQTVFNKLRENDGELHLLYGAEGWFDFQPLYLGASFTGRGWLSSGGSFNDSVINQAAVRAKLVFEKFSPGAYFRVPLDDLLLDNVVGLYLDVML